MEDFASNHFSEWARNICSQMKVRVDGDLLNFSDDASFRRYFRFSNNSGGLVFVNAPPEKEDNQSFVKIAAALKNSGIPCPLVQAFNFDFGYLAVSDLGNRLFLDEIEKYSSTRRSLYRLAINELIKMQDITCDIPFYTEKKLLEEMALFDEWFVKNYLLIKPSKSVQRFLKEAYSFLAKQALDQPQVFVHRDYHSKNLMLSESLSVAMIDFQDAVIGPVTYDLVSLLKDCYVDLSPSLLHSEADFFHKALLKKGTLERDFSFQEKFDFMGIQRHLKCAGIFARLNLRDGKPKYLSHIPRVLNYLRSSVERYSEFDEFNRFLVEEIIPISETFVPFK
ncbi:MAG: phosphotransferase [Pseudomonadota bacterium]|nr:phosphotransferase [Pseudomonadota bacterium]